MDNKAEASQVRKIRLGPCATSDRQQVSLSVRKIYIECDNDITETQKEEIMKLGISTVAVDNFKVFCTAKALEYKKGKSTSAFRHKRAKHLTLV